MTDLLAGKFSNEPGKQNSPSFADMDEALDIILKNCNSYSSLSQKLGHLHCRELLLSFCWLNLKSLSFVMSELGNLCNTFKKEANLLSDSHLKLVESFFQKTLITCRHKGVIENSLVALTKFARSVSPMSKVWSSMSTWCNCVIESSTTLGMHSSVTKRR